MNEIVTAPGLLHGHEAPAGDAAPAPRLMVRLLDGFQVRSGGVPLGQPPHGRMRTLFKLLLLQHPRPLPRARLCALLWPEAAPDKARNCLNVALHGLRRALGDACAVHHDDDGYRLRPPGELWLDTDQFVRHADAGRHDEAAGRRAAAVAQYEAALALYQSDLSSDLLHEDEFEAALAGEAQALRDRLSEVLERLSGLNEAAGDWHGGLRAALRHLGLDPCNERAHQRLMVCYARLGQLSLAERQYRRCVERLRGDLGLAPSAQTTSLYRRLAAREEA